MSTVAKPMSKSAIRKAVGPEIFGRSALYYERYSEEELKAQGYTDKQLGIIKKELARCGPPRYIKAPPPGIQAVPEFAIIVADEKGNAEESVVTELPHALVGAYYLTALHSQGGYEPVYWTGGRPGKDDALLDELPGGLTLNRLGHLSGTVAKEGEYSFAVTVTDNLGNQDVMSLTLIVEPPPDAEETEQTEEEKILQPVKPARNSLLAVDIPQNYQLLYNADALKGESAIKGESPKTGTEELENAKTEASGAKAIEPKRAETESGDSESKQV